MEQFKCAECGLLLKPGYACACGSDMAEPVERPDDAEISADKLQPAPAPVGAHRKDVARWARKYQQKW